MQVLTGTLCIPFRPGFIVMNFVQFKILSVNVQFDDCRFTHYSTTTEPEMSKI